MSSFWPLPRPQSPSCCHPWQFSHPPQLEALGLLSALWSGNAQLGWSISESGQGSLTLAVLLLLWRLFPRLSSLGFLLPYYSLWFFVFLSKSQPSAVTHCTISILSCKVRPFLSMIWLYINIGIFYCTSNCFPSIVTYCLSFFKERYFIKHKEFSVSSVVFSAIIANQLY